jgi:hypothetical protein
VSIAEAVAVGKFEKTLPHLVTLVEDNNVRLQSVFVVQKFRFHGDLAPKKDASSSR